MDKQSAYTAQEMREKAKSIEMIPMMGLELTSKEKLELAAMLRQAADAEDELANLKTTSGELEKRALEYAQVVSSPLLTNTIKHLITERNSLKARLDAVAKECEKMRDDFSKRMRSFTGMFALNMKSIYEDKIEIVDDILHTARGEESAQQQA